MTVSLTGAWDNGRAALFTLEIILQSTLLGLCSLRPSFGLEGSKKEVKRENTLESKVW